jgi:hypothetical protein
MAKKKQYNPNEDSEGFGDTIAYLTNLLKIDKAVKAVTEALGIEDCGCERRRETLNEIFPYKKDEEKKDI